MTGRQKPTPGLTKELLEEHNRLYPAVHQVKVKEIEAKLIKTDTTCADPTYCPMRSLKKEYAYALNSVRLHDYYFKNIGSAQSEPSSEIRRFIERDFGSMEEWARRFYALALCARGWVVLGFDLRDGVLRNLFTDDHSEGVWGVLPLLTLDIYEHAYYNSFPSRNAYIESFLERVDWEIVRKRFRAAREAYQITKPLF